MGIDRRIVLVFAGLKFQPRTDRVGSFGKGLCRVTEAHAFRAGADRGSRGEGLSEGKRLARAGNYYQRS
ncbi:MAG: hypothetical protein LC746_10785 [Acidobacteria bacterium]|nr:hypothetical protein [Acidobacteriota bacterium]